ncbi:uncharacterized protein LOC110189739 [Drosophila serrata]|uniref:uncharacterized protein LOC110189739 n=1 Tax=Drosophila serrata TaxID=7274 RepID=UPI000A1D074E|nr:uncharacterized protein LOC110189739 [Drosophila serrata]
MPAILDEFITLTPLTCVQQVNALLNAASSKPRGCKVFCTLFGVYCGVLAYRAYKVHSKRIAVQDGQAANIAVEAVNEVEETDLISAFSDMSGRLAPDPSPILLQPADMSNTDMLWRYGPQTTSELKPDSESSDEDERSITKSNGGSEVATVSVGTSTKGKHVRKHEDKIEGESTKANFSV